MENWLLPVLLIPACALLLSATAPRLVLALNDVHHATHDLCEKCAAHASGFRLRVRLLSGAGFLLLMACCCFSLSGLLGGIDELARVLPNLWRTGSLLLGVALLLGGCGSLAAESLLLYRGVADAGQQPGKG